MTVAVPRYEVCVALIVDIRHWLDEHGELPLDNVRLRRRALRIAQLIDYAGPLAVGEFRETLVECSSRPKRRPCSGLLWVEKAKDDHIRAYCLACGDGEIMISGWQETRWADGPMAPERDDGMLPAALIN